MTKYSLALIPFLMASTALAGPATPEGATRLTEVFQTYLGATEGVVAVAPQGETYLVTLDATPLMKSFAETGFTATVSPIEMTLTDNGDGTWAVTQDQPFSMLSNDGMGGETKQDIARVTMEGVFDESLMAFTSQTGTLEGQTTTATSAMPDGTSFSYTAKTDKTTLTQTAAAGATGGVDGKLTYGATGFSMTGSFVEAAGAPPVEFAVTAASGDYAGTFTGLRTEGILGVLAFVVAHPDEAAMEAAKDEAKLALTGLLPGWNTMVVDGKLAQVAAETPLGPVGIDEVTFVVDINGAVPEGKFREAVTFSGLTLPPGLVPDWVAPVLPSKASIDFEVTGFDPAAGFAALMGAFDLPDDPMADTSAFDAAVEKAFLPDGTIRLALNPGAISGTGYELTYEGDMLVDTATEMPSGKALITLTGAETLQAAIQAAPQEMQMEAMMGFGMAQGMARQEGDKLVWEIDATNPMNPLINGVSVMGGQ